MDRQSWREGFPVEYFKFWLEIFPDFNLNGEYAHSRANRKSQLDWRYRLAAFLLVADNLAGRVVWEWADQLLIKLPATLLTYDLQCRLDGEIWDTCFTNKIRQCFVVIPKPVFEVFLSGVFLAVKLTKTFVVFNYKLWPSNNLGDSLHFLFLCYWEDLKGKKSKENGL